MQNALPPVDGFLQVSQVLTGVADLDESLAKGFYDRLKTHFGEGLDALINQYDPTWKDPEKQLQDAVKANRALAPVARAVIKAWYTGEFKPTKEVTDGPQTPAEYAKGVLWKVIQAHPPGYTNGSFGAWAEPPKGLPVKVPTSSTSPTAIPQLTLQADYDVIVVGSGVAGALLAFKLKTAKPDARIAVLEAGDNDIDDTARARFQQVYALSVERDSISAYKRLDALAKVPSPSAGVDRTHLVQGGPDDFKSNYARLLGGSTWPWRGNCPRFTPADFELKKRYGIADDWPIKYADILPDFGEAERELGIAGDTAEWDPLLQGDRGDPYPLPKIPQALGDELLKSELDRVSGGKLAVIDGKTIRVIATPQARWSAKANEERGQGQCEGNASCIPICPSGAKYDAGVHVRLGEKKGVEYHRRFVVTQVRPSTDGKMVVTYRTWAKPGDDQTVIARFVVIAGNAIETPRLWLASKLENGQDLVGKYLMDHVQGDVVCRTPRPIYPFRGPQNTSSVVSFFDHDNRKNVSAFNISVGNDGWGRYTTPDNVTKSPFNILDELMWDSKLEQLAACGSVLQRKLRDDKDTAITHMLRLSFSTEQLPEPQNRVSLADEKDAYGMPRPKIAYKLSDYSKRSLAYARSVVCRIIQAAGMTPVEGSYLSSFQYAGAGHLMGTCRMGDSPANSVVNSNGRSWAHPSVFVVGSSVFVTGGCTNPTIALAALTIRAARALAKDL